MVRRLLVAALLVVMSWPVMAQTVDEPVMGTSGATEDVIAEDKQDRILRILALGDAMGGGLGAGLVRMGEIDGRYDVTIRFNEESGLARPEVYDWSTTLPKILESSDYDVIVMLIGVNDRQMIRHGNARYAFGSADWVKAYREQVDRVLDALQASGARVFWVSLPPMQDPEYDAAMRLITDIQKEQVEARGMAFVDIRPVLLNPDGSYTDVGRDSSGTVFRVRGRDGKSFYKQGNNLIGEQVLKAIATRKVPEKKTVSPAAPPRRPVARSLRPRRVVPIFGQTTFSGDFALLRPDNVTVSTALVLSAGRDGLAPSDAMAMLRAIAQPGSAAEALFTKGAASASPAGRADDFSLPSAPAPE